MAKLSFDQINGLKGVERSSTLNKRMKAGPVSTQKLKFKQNRSSNLPGRNEPCLCGSGKKFKHCCYEK